jgi:hypothetical protein
MGRPSSIDPELVGASACSAGVVCRVPTSDAIVGMPDSRRMGRDGAVSFLSGSDTTDSLRTVLAQGVPDLSALLSRTLVSDCALEDSPF